MNELPYVVTTVSISSGCDFCICSRCSLSRNNRCILPCVVTGHLISRGWIFICYHCCFNLTVDVVFHMLSLASLKKEWSSVSVCYDFILNKQWIVFSVITFVQEAVHVIFDMFSMFCHCIFSKHWKVFFHYISLHFHSFLSFFPFLYFFTTLFQKPVDVVSMLPPHIS